MWNGRDSDVPAAEAALRIIKDAEIARLQAELDNIRQVEFPRRVAKVADGWRGKVERLEAELAEAKKPGAAAAAALAEWEKLKDPVILHNNLLRGFPARLSEDSLLHLLGGVPAIAELIKDRRELHRIVRECAVALGAGSSYTDSESIEALSSIPAKIREQLDGLRKSIAQLPNGTYDPEPESTQPKRTLKAVIYGSSFNGCEGWSTWQIGTVRFSCNESRVAAAKSRFERRIRKGANHYERRDVKWKNA